MIMASPGNRPFSFDAQAFRSVTCQMIGEGNRFIWLSQTRHKPVLGPRHAGPRPVTGRHGWQPEPLGLSQPEAGCKIEFYLHARPATPTAGARTLTVTGTTVTACQHCDAGSPE